VVFFVVIVSQIRQRQERMQLDVELKDELRGKNFSKFELRKSERVELRKQIRLSEN